MKSLLSLIAISFLALLIIFAGCGSPASTTPSPSNTTPYVPNIHISIQPCENDPEGKIVIDNVTVTTGTLDRDYFTPTAGKHLAGELCFLVGGNIKNGYNVDCWVAYHIEGFNVSGHWVSSTLDTGPLPGWGQVYIAADSSMPFNLHLSWADDITDFIISSQRTTRTEP
jgi:hypothetical protein